MILKDWHWKQVRGKGSFRKTLRLKSEISRSWKNIEFDNSLSTENLIWVLKINETKKTPHYDTDEKG